MRVLSAVVIAALAAACSTPGSTDSARKRPPRSGGKQHTMANCPSMVIGAVTRLDVVEGGVDLTITAVDRVSREAIAERARVHSQLGDPTPWELEHSGRHGGPGSIGYCPIIHDGTTVKVVELPNGALLQVRARRPDDAARVQIATRDRVDALPRNR
jgi:hypothetical protein